MMEIPLVYTYILKTCKALSCMKLSTKDHFRHHIDIEANCLPIIHSTCSNFIIEISADTLPMVPEISLHTNS
jgi:hypothetical protein